MPIIIEVPLIAEKLFINNVGCLRYTITKGGIEESKCIEPMEMGVYLYPDKHIVTIGLSTNNKKYVVISEKKPLEEKPTNPDERIICSGIQITSTGKVYNGHRHNHCIEAMNGELSWSMNRQQISKIEKVQGFVTSHGRFVTREEGLIIAVAQNQVLDATQIRGNQLFSEDLY
jgi:hypothetical protein